MSGAFHNARRSGALVGVVYESLIDLPFGLGIEKQFIFIALLLERK